MPATLNQFVCQKIIVMMQLQYLKSRWQKTPSLLYQRVVMGNDDSVNLPQLYFFLPTFKHTLERFRMTQI
jgi:hypothetical protein